MLGGLYGDLPPPSSAGEDDKASTASVWSSATKMAPPTLRKPSTTFAPPPSLLRNQHLRPPKTASASASAALATAAPVVAAEPAPAPSFQPAFVAVQSTVLQEHDPARPNDYEDYHKDKLRRTKKAKLCKELEWPAASERSPPAPPADQARLNLSVQPSSTSTDTPPLMTDVIHTQGKAHSSASLLELTCISIVELLSVQFLKPIHSCISI